MSELFKLLGRVVLKDGINYTVTSLNGPKGLICVWNPSTSTLFGFDSIETFENWAYRKPMSTRGREER